jgi:glutaredoxin 3
MFRALVFLALAGLLVLGAIEYGGTVMEMLGVASPSSDLSGSASPTHDDEAGDSGPHWSDLPDTPPAEAETPEPRTTYRYFDANGSLHFVDALEKVPEPFRASAKPMGSSELPQITHAETKRPRRPTGYGSSIRKIPRDGSPGAAPARQAPRGVGEVVVYTAPWCNWCRKTLAWLDERGVEYENRDIEENEAFKEELIEKTGRGSIPMVEIDGEIIRGFDPQRMSELL